ncbi:XTP/dITP diphosphatase [Desmospora profundinema]|uniref:dITP/XTP pyrophosphatase n=1 Tax=Desmospora profundinema TaxID=1571184 RepID=A0ABU1INV5_9BACL|nr:XTP/dITP diphosphatase [Desmospora profundinema]MDR6226467.1 XTP/dITP diphosphohydrolase [Desmospora profundinema]
MAETKKETWQWSELVIATGNRHKVEELNAMVYSSLGIRVVGLSAFSGLPAIVEDRDTFEGNAVKKAETIAHHLQRPVAADDSGLAVKALQGAPGVRSARYAGEHATDAENNAKLLSELEGIPPQERGAAFVCALALAVPGEPTRIVRGECPGYIAEESKGEHGFGYDPLFWLPDRNQTMAQLARSEKNRISHRARAVEKLIISLKDRYQFS